MKRIVVTVLTLFALLLSGCSRDTDVEAFISKLDTHTTEIVSRVEGAKDRKAGVESAQRYFDENKGELQTSYSTIKGLRGYQVKQETVQKLSDSVISNGSKVAGLKIKLMSETMSDTELDKKLEKLTADYAAVFEGS